MLASLALTATLEVGYFVYLKNFPARILVPSYEMFVHLALFLKLHLQRRICTSLSENGMTSSPFMGLISIIELVFWKKKTLSFILDHFDAAYTVYCK